MSLTPEEISTVAAQRGDTVVNPTGSSSAPMTAAQAFAQRTGYNPNGDTTDPQIKVNTGGVGPIDLTEPTLDAVKNTAKDYSNAIPNFLKAAQSSQIKTNPGSGISDVIPETGKLLENTGAAVTSAIGTIFSPITNLVKSYSDAFANSDAGKAVEQNPVVGKILDVFGGGNKAMSDWATAHSDAASSLNSALTIALTAAGGGEKGLDKPIGTVEGIKNSVSDTASALKDKVTGTASNIRESVAPTLTPEEQVGKIIQGKPSDIPAAQRTFESLSSDVNPAKMTPSDLSDAVQSKIDSNMDEVSSNFKGDNNPHPMEDFEQKTGTGSSEVKTNYVQQAIDQLKDFYTKTNDAQGLSDIKALEEKANTEGLTSEELNNLAKEHGSTIKAFNANGEAASGLSKQAAENTRMGLKTTARNILSETNPEGAAEVTRLDKETSDAIKTKNLLDNQVEKGAIKIQKNGKPNIIQKFAKEHPTATKIGSGLIGGEGARRIITGSF